MEFTRRFPNPPSRPPHEDTMMVTRDALLSQLQKEDGVRRRKGKQSKERHVTEDGFVTASSKASSSTCKPACAQKNLTRDDEGKSQESSEATKSPFMKWSCAICRVEATSAGNLLQHFSGQKHRANIDALKAKAEAEKSRKATQCAAKSCPPWMCMFCHANCTGKPDLESHLNGRRHRAKIQALLEECESMGRDFASSREADSRSSITSQDDEKPASESICGICQVKWSCQSVMEGHVGGKKHRKNFQALQLEAKRLGIIQPEVTKKQETWVCKFCPANCTGKSVLENHLKGKKHHRKIQALLEECKSMTQDHALAEAGSNPNMDEGKPDSVLICGICKVKCVSASVKESHVRGKKHQINLQALHLEAKRLGIVPPKVAKNQQAPPE